LSGLSPLESRDQLELFADEFSKKRTVEETVLKLKRKMGNIALTKASLLRKDGRIPRGDVDPPPHGTDA
jgi:hypothetical protein